MTIRHRLNLAYKALTVNMPQGTGSLFNLLTRTKYDYEKEVGTGRQSAVIMACVKWMQRTFPEAPVMLEKQQTKGEWEEVWEHPLLTLLERPNEYYDGLLLQSATIADIMLTGNAYWLKLRTNGGRTAALWWIPSTMIEPKWNIGSNDYITYYEYRPGYDTIRIDPLDIVHFRDGLDPDNIRKGLSPLKSLFREVFSDDEAANMTASLLRNLGVPGMVISPKDQMGSSDDLKQTKEWFKERFTGDYRGEPLVMSAATDVNILSFNPQQLDLKALRRIPEERVSAVFGIPAIVVGLGAGLDRSTFANYKEAREAAYESNIIPSQRLFASVVKHSLLSEFEDDLTKWNVGYDLSEVRILQEDETALSLRTIAQVNGGILKVMDSQRILGLPVDDTQDYYLRPFNIIPSASGEMPISSGAMPLKSAGQAIERKLSPQEWEAEYSEGVPHWAEDKNPSLFAQEFLLEVQNRKFKKLLEIGCGNGRDSVFFALAGLDVTAIDVSKSAIKLAKQNAKDAEATVVFQVANAEALSYADAEFDAIFSLSVLHSTKLGKSIPEVARVLRNKGIAFIYLYGDTQYADGHRDEIITIDDYLKLLKTNAFTLLNVYSEQEDQFDEFGEKHLLLVSLMEKGS